MAVPEASVETPGSQAGQSPVTQANAAPQRDDAERQPAPGVRGAGPHPLPVFLGVVADVCRGDNARLARVLAGVRRYQAAPRLPRRPLRTENAHIGSTVLRDYGGTGLPVVVVPSLINPPTVLDLAEGNSLLGYLADAGLRPLLVDWGTPGTAELGLDLAGHVEHRLLPLIESVGQPVMLAGYCLGGTLAVAAAQLAGPARVTRLALLAAPWRFTGYGEAARTAMTGYWRNAAPLAAHLGALPMDMLQPAFWSLDPASLAAKFERFGAMADGPAADAFVVLEDWANDGPPLPLPVARDLAEHFYGDDAPGTGAWRVGGRAVDPAGLTMPLLDIVARRDRIVPPAAALSGTGIGQPLGLDAGHVGMVVGGRARALLWEPLAQWLRAA